MLQAGNILEFIAYISTGVIAGMALNALHMLQRTLIMIIIESFQIYCCRAICCMDNL